MKMNVVLEVKGEDCLVFRFADTEMGELRGSKSSGAGIKK